ncbi:hypothetical protein FOCG_11900 [Fusarium oxysporum f. sp. radicis-lycopersici 26381]|nr:hypothetical protein FOCG_11900 [Fusarium oxysporum f. sp. radicis-lycopersici 26381]
MPGGALRGLLYYVASAIGIGLSEKATGKVCKSVTLKKWLAGFWPVTA